MTRLMCMLSISIGLPLLMAACQDIDEGAVFETNEATSQLSTEKAESTRVAGILSLENCAWRGPYVRENSKADVGLLDYGASYWTLFGTARKALPYALKESIPGRATSLSILTK